MLQLLSSVLLCTNIQFDINNVSVANSGIIVSLTEKGLLQYFNNNIQFVNTGLDQIIVPDIKLSVANFQLFLSDIKFKNVVFPNLTGSLSSNNGGRLSVRWQGVQLQLALQFKIQQQTYPFISDSGPGQVVVSDADVAISFGAAQDNECLYHIKLNFDYVNMKISQMQISLQGQFQFLYDSVLRLISQVVMNALNDQLEQPIMNKMNMNMANFYQLSFNHGPDNCPQTDQRWWLIVMRDRYFDAYSPGNVCMYDDRKRTCIGNSTISIDDEPLKTNDEFQYQFSLRSLQSQQNMIQQYKFLKDLAKPCDAQIFATGIIVQCQTNQTAFTTLYSSHVNLAFWYEEHVLQLNLKLQNIMQCIGNCTQQYFEDVQKALDATAIGYDNTNFVNLTSCKIRYSKGWIHAGCASEL